jgi:hypothetical protein
MRLVAALILLLCLPAYADTAVYSDSISQPSMKGSLYQLDSLWGKVFTKTTDPVVFPAHEGASEVHPDMIPSPLDNTKVLLTFTPETPATAENMTLVTALKSDLTSWSDTSWINPVLSYDPAVGWKRSNCSDYCLLYISELPQKWWTWFHPCGDMGAWGMNCQIAIGTSTDGITWIDTVESGNGPVMYPNDDGNTWEQNDLRSPSVIWNRKTQRFEMLYDSVTAGSPVTAVLGHAESITGKSWVGRVKVIDGASVSLGFYHPVMRYFDGWYWAWFPGYPSGVYMSQSRTGMPGSWSTPIQIIPSSALSGGLYAYRAGAYIDATYKLHLMVSYVYQTSPDFRYRIAYFTSDLSDKSKTLFNNYTVNDFDGGGSIRQ